ncbi:MAG: hypothetical protein OCD02_07730 [Spirochaetaceae bacterium]
MNRQYKRALTILILLLTTLMLTSATKSPYYTKHVVITRIYPHQLGYKVIYMANNLEYREIYLPNELFTKDVDRSKIFKGYDKAYPYMTVFWNNGEFSHVKLYLKSDFNDITWGVFQNPTAHDENFKNPDLKFDF